MTHEQFLPILQITISALATFVLTVFYNYAFYTPLVKRLNENLEKEGEIAQRRYELSISEVQPTQVQPTQVRVTTKPTPLMILPTVAQVSLTGTVRRQGKNKVRVGNRYVWA